MHIIKVAKNDNAVISYSVFYLCNIQSINQQIGLTIQPTTTGPNSKKQVITQSIWAKLINLCLPLSE